MKWSRADHATHGARGEQPDTTMLRTVPEPGQDA
jgi:hypothetical protein